MAWSDTGTGKTNQANDEPLFDARPSTGPTSGRRTALTIQRDVDENTRPGQSVGNAVRADDGDGDKRTYKLVDADNHTGDAALFDIDESSGQIRTKSPLNHEATGDDAPGCGYDSTADPTTCTYTVMVQVRDGKNEHGVEEETENATPDDSITVQINVRDKDEPPAVPTVTVTSPSGNVTLGVVWDAPANTGPATITYDLQYRKGSGSFSNDNCGSTSDDNCDGISTTTTTIMGLTANTSYSVQVRARNDDGPSNWSRLVTVKTNKGDNAPPSFSTNSSTFTVAENTRPGQSVGDAVTAGDNDSSAVSYTLEGPDAASFSLNTKTGAITTRSSLNHEDPECGYVSTADPNCMQLLGASESQRRQRRRQRLSCRDDQRHRRR